MRLRPETAKRGESDVPTYRLRPGATEIYFALPPIAQVTRTAHAGTRILVRVRGPESRDLASTELDFDALAAQGTLVLRNDGAPLDPGRYAVEAFTVAAGSRIAELSWNFDLLP